MKFRLKAMLVVNWRVEDQGPVWKNWTAQMGNAEGLCLLSGPQAGSCRLVQDQDGADFCFVGVFMKDCYYILLFLNNYLNFFFHLEDAVGHTGDFI